MLGVGDERKMAITRLPKRIYSLLVVPPNVPTVKGRLPEAAVPSATETRATPSTARSAVVIVAVSEVELPNVVIRPVPFQSTWEVDVKLPPVTVSVSVDDPVVADEGDSDVTVGATMNADPLLARAPTVTTTFALVAPAGTVTVMLVFDQHTTVPDPHVLVGVAVIPLRVTVLVP